MPPWELQAVEYIVGAVLLGLALVVATDPDHLCDARPDPYRRTQVYSAVEANMTAERAVAKGFDVCVNDNGP